MKNQRQCVICQKPIKSCAKPSTNCFTCSLSCASKLAWSTRYANQLRKRFSYPEKNKIREIIFKRYIKPSCLCEKPIINCFNVLDFWGGGLFSDYVIDQIQCVKNPKTPVNLYEIDSDKKLFPALRKYAIEKNQHKVMKNQAKGVKIVPFCGSLAEFVHKLNMKNQINTDLIWLDYCGMGDSLKEDLEVLSSLIGKKTNLVMTFFTFNGRIKKVIEAHVGHVTSIVNECLPRLSMNGDAIHYTKNLFTVFFKQKYDFPKKYKYYESEISKDKPNYASNPV